MWGRRRMRSHLPRWAMLLYYPQRTSMDMGPTAILPGTTYWTVDHGNILERYGEPFGEDRLDWPGFMDGTYSSPSLAVRDRALADAPHKGFGFSPAEAAALEAPHALTGRPRVVIMSYDMFHRASRRRRQDAQTRFLFKLQFYRTQEPAPAANHNIISPVSSLPHAEYPSSWPPLDAVVNTSTPADGGASAADADASSTVLHRADGSNYHGMGIVLRRSLGPVWRTMRDWLRGLVPVPAGDAVSKETLGFCLQVLRTEDSLAVALDDDDTLAANIPLLRTARRSEAQRIGCAYLLGHVVNTPHDSMYIDTALCPPASL